MKYVIAFCVLLTSGYVFAQVNLVPNPSFEIITDCPNDPSQLPFATPWFGADGTPDLFNTCATSGQLSVPSNVFGYQYPRSGDGYAGSMLYYPASDYREFLGVQLISDLVVNETYCVSFYVSLCSKYYLGINNIGMYFSTAPLVSPILPLNLTPQINHTSIITDTAGWALIEGQYNAQGGERYITIGSFSPKNLTDTFHFPNLDQSTDVSYFYIDDIDVHAGECTTHHTSISPINKNSQESIKMYPNPFTSQTTITFTEEQNNTPISITDILGNKIKTVSFTGKELTIKKEELKAGMYVVQIGAGKNRVVRKLVVE